MLIVRPIRMPDDVDAVKGLDMRFTTTDGYAVERLYDVDGTIAGFRLGARKSTEPLAKQYYLTPHDGAFVAEIRGMIVGYAYVNVATWNRRAVIDAFYVEAKARRSGVGTALMAAVAARAKESGARCLWLETQNVNGPAVAFFRRVGFALCGHDASLYDGKEQFGEIALFFSRSIV
jgi:ribosomal protein S18 acetylase RimI-like enzyme